MRIEKDDILNNIFHVDDTTYLVHNYHPYAAKFIPQLPRYLIKKFTNPYDVVLDPFCGSGTTIVEDLLLRRFGIGIEINPIGALVSKVKTTPLSDKQILYIMQFLKELEIIKKILLSKYQNNNFFQCNDKYEYNLPDLADTLNFPNKFHWFKKDVLDAILQIKNKIDDIDDMDVRDFLLVALSSIIVMVSNQESETRYAAIDKDINIEAVFILFKNKVKDMTRRMQEFNSSVSKDVYGKIYRKDSRFIDFIPENSVDFIITSPPYPNTYDYYLYHKLRMVILGFDYKYVQKNEIGSRHKHSSKREDISTYVHSVKQCFQNFAKILKPGHYFAIIIGDSVIRSKKYDGYDLIKNIASSTRFEVTQHISYDLDGVSRLFNKSFRIKGKKEHIIILKNIK